MTGIAVAYRWELRKLAAQKRTYLGLAGMALLPLIFTVTVAIDGGNVEGSIFGRVSETGLTTPLILLFFGSAFLFPLTAALVAGDIVATEDHHGTLKTILTRSIDRGAVFGAKALAAITYGLVSLLVFAAVAVAAGVAAWGLHPLTSLSGTEIAVPRALALIGAALAAYLIPLITVASIALVLSTVARNSAAAVVGTLLIVVLMQIVAGIPGTEAVQPYLLPDQFDAWQGLLRDPIDWAPIGHAAWVSLLYAVPCLVAAAAVFRRRDVAGG
ncbi:MAG TPA: ABC transporter permease [Solirubrobacteraceae bacterium]|nr:ABC transporter permease [Solirubrobacteraceae bacterium]